MLIGLIKLIGAGWLYIGRSYIFSKEAVIKHIRWASGLIGSK